MSKTIIEKHLYGTIDVKNTKDGACFNVTIPICHEEKKDV
jgi:sensor histidine kinase regulating citrate/malate metabolism